MLYSKVLMDGSEAPFDSNIYDNMLIYNRAVLITRFIAGYDIAFVRWIRVEIHKRAFREFSTIPIPFLVQRLCDAIEVLPIPDIDQWDKVTARQI